MTTFSRTLIGLILLVAIGGALALSTGFPDLVGATGGAFRSETVDVAQNDAERAEIDLSLDAGRLELGALGADDPRALAGTIELGSRQRLVGELDSGARLAASYRVTSRPGVTFGAAAPAWRLALAPELPSALRVRTEIGDARLDLRGTRVHDLEVRTDVGRQHVYLPAAELTADLATDLGEIAVWVPESARVDLRLAPGVRATRIDGAFERVAGGWRLDGDGPRIELRVASGMGAVTVGTY